MEATSAAPLNKDPAETGRDIREEGRLLAVPLQSSSGPVGGAEGTILLAMQNFMRQILDASTHILHFLLRRVPSNKLA